MAFCGDGLFVELVEFGEVDLQFATEKLSAARGQPEFKACPFALASK